MDSLEASSKRLCNCHPWKGDVGCPTGGHRTMFLEGLIRRHRVGMGSHAEYGNLFISQ
jgi:hypothetical protein